MPKYFVSLTCSSVWPQSVYRYIVDIGCFDLVILNILVHMEALNFVLHFSPNSCSLIKSSCSANWSSVDLTEWYRRQLSANRWICELTSCGKSLICIRNNSGPNAVLCETPDFTGTLLEISPSTTHLSLPVKKICYPSINIATDTKTFQLS